MRQCLLVPRYLLPCVLQFEQLHWLSARPSSLGCASTFGQSTLCLAIVSHLRLWLPTNDVAQAHGNIPE